MQSIFEFNVLINWPEGWQFTGRVSGLEVHPVSDDGTGKPSIVLNEGEAVSYYSVYVHYEAGGLDAVADCKDEKTAKMLARLLAQVALRSKTDSPLFEEWIE